jgi:hypothetical protein
MKNQKVIIGIAGVLLVLVAGYFLVFNKSTKESVVAEPQTSEEKILTLSPEEIGLTLTAIESNRKVLMEIANTSDVVSLEYELSYTSKGDIPRGVLGTIDIKSKNKPIEHEIVLGTCSDVCHYDEDVSNIKVILKVTKSDNKVYQSEKTLEP